MVSLVTEAVFWLMCLCSAVQWVNQNMDLLTFKFVKFKFIRAWEKKLNSRITLSVTALANIYRKI